MKSSISFKSRMYNYNNSISDSNDLSMDYYPREIHCYISYKLIYLNICFFQTLNYSKNNNVLANFDFSKIDAKDPSLREGHKLIYNREASFELKLEYNDGPQKMASFEAIRCKILLGGMRIIQFKLDLN